MSKCLGRDISVRQHSKSEHSSRHRRDMSERLLKATLSPNQTSKQEWTISNFRTSMVSR